jgi:hypothetical protein
MRFTEEVELLQEEMEHVLRYLKWQEDWWIAKGLGTGWRDLTEARAEGLHAYVEHQAILHRSLREHFSTLWKDVPFFVSLAREAISYGLPDTNQAPVQ